jgi:hypothetical protein
VLPFEKEQSFAETIRIIEKWGFGLSRTEVISTDSEYRKNNGIKTPFKNGVPGKEWFFRFLEKTDNYNKIV